MSNTLQWDPNAVESQWVLLHEAMKPETVRPMKHDHRRSGDTRLFNWTSIGYKCACQTWCCRTISQDGEGKRLNFCFSSWSFYSDTWGKPGQTVSYTPKDDVMTRIWQITRIWLQKRRWSQEWRNTNIMKCRRSDKDQLHVWKHLELEMHFKLNKSRENKILI